MVEIPKSFKNICADFYPHSEEKYLSPEAWVEGTVQGFVSAKDRPRLRAFLDALLSEPHSDRELDKLFSRFNPSIGFPDGGIRVFLAMVRDALN